MATAQSKDFNKRLSQWVANQGFWFQLRYSMFSGGVRGRAMFHLMRLFFQLAIFLLLASIVSWVFLLKRTESEGFSEQIESKIKQGIAGEAIAIRGMSYSQGQLEIPRMAAEGADGTFFSSLQLVSLRCKMGLLDGLIGTWDPGVISVAKMNIELRAGSDDDASAANVAKVIFEESDKVKVNTLEVGSVNLRWGYSERTQGGIESSVMTAQRTNKGWRLSFKGGTFRQNWIKDLEIVSLVALCEPSGIKFERAEFKQGEGTVDFSGLRVKAGSRPEVVGQVRVKRLQLESVLPAAAEEFAEGTFSGDFRVFGSTNSSDGVGFEGQVLMTGDDVITLRDRLPLLTALSVMDYSRNYHRIDFKEGSFFMKTMRGGMELSGVDLVADDLFTLKGQMNVRLPTQEEIRQAVAQGGDKRGLLGVTFRDGGKMDQDFLNGEAEFSLKRAAMEAKRAREGEKDPDSYTLFDRLSLNTEMRELELAAAERMSRMLQYEGSFQITIPDDAFERAGDLQKAYPVDPETNRIPIEVPIKGPLYQLTDEQAEAIYKQGRRL